MKFPRRLLLILFVSLMLISLRSLAADETNPAIVPTRRIELFNGKDLTGWKFFMRGNANPTNTWSAADGLIKCTGQPTGYLRTEKDYRNYELTAEWRFVKIGPKADNGGILVHMRLPDKIWPLCIQCQGKHDAVGDLFLMSGAESKEHRGMDANTPLVKHGESAEKSVGDWNICKLICSGNSVKVYVNGRLMNETTECTVTSGKIGFQAEGAAFEVRRVYIEPVK
ncbi:MAG TPA: DUF1080 domain-containing protein [Verrucomicrobiae bacterium]|jgi:hypothetical protein|nr:DUF1080 domain-containing protein [Verrucomicrobiae bacterium]